MKKFTLILIPLFIASYACDSILEIEPDGIIGADALTNGEDLERALTGTYFNLGGISDGIDGGELLGGDFIIMSTLLAHVPNIEIIWDRVNGFTYNDFIDKDILLTNPRVQSNWRRAYETINQVNTILANVDNIESTGDQNRIRGEALAIRGVLYFEMIRLWGPQYGTGSDNLPAIPLILEPIIEVGDIVTPELATVQAIYDQAENDLVVAEALLEPFGNNGSGISSGTCNAYLGRMALQKSDYPVAETFATEVIESGNFSLESDFLNAFNNASNSSEDIFAIQQNEASNTGDRSFGTGLAFYYSSLNESGLGALRLTLFFLIDGEIVNNGPIYPIADARSTIDFDVDITTTSSQITTAYHKNILNNTVLSPAKYLSSNNVIPVIRLAEVLLMRSEAIYEQHPAAIDATALNDLNQIRTRAGLTALTLSDFASASEFGDAIRLERRRELLFEGQHLHDLKRWNGFVGSSNARDSRFILPIPQAETDTGTGD